MSASASANDPALESLETLLKSIAVDAKLEGDLLEKLTKAQELVQNAKVRSKGILSKFCLDGQVALVTGGGQGIGRVFAHALGEAGCRVAIADLQLERVQAVSKELDAKGIPNLALKVDVSIKKEVDEMVQKVVDTFGDLTIACNNAGIVFVSPSEDTSESEWNKTMGVNLNGVYFCCQAEAQHMLKKGYGRIINTASMSGSINNRPQFQTAYNVSKAGVIHMTKSLGAEWATRGVTVNAISPGYVDTALSRSEAARANHSFWIRDTPMGRIGDPEELSGAVVYLASPLASFTTGLDMIIDGGYTCW